MAEQNKGQFFNEIYGTYYNTMAVVVEAARNGALDDEKLYEIVRENSFAESVIPITDAIREERWQLVTSSFKTNIRNKPGMPLTNLQRRFLKSMVMDKRAKLFFSDWELSELEGDLKDVEPLFNPDDVERYDKNAEGDDYADSPYGSIFREFLEAVRAERPVRINGIGKDGKGFSLEATPHHVEYSVRDDRFKACFGDGGEYAMVNMARIRGLDEAGGGEGGRGIPYSDDSVHPERKKEILLEISDERNALERISFNFSYLKKRCEKIGENRYLMAVTIDDGDVQDMVARVLQFGPYVKAVGPECFVERIKERLRGQKGIGELGA